MLAYSAMLNPRPRPFFIVGLAAFGVAALAACDRRLGTAGSDGTPAAIEPAYRPSPIPSAHAARTGKADQALRAAWGRRIFLEAFDRAGGRNPRCARGARRLIEGGLASVLGLGHGPDPLDLVPQGKALLAAGCRDPLTLYIHARNLSATEQDSIEPARILEQVVEAMKTAPYSRAVARYVASGLQREYERRGEGRGLRQALAPLELKWFEESLGDSYRRGDDAVLACQLQTGTGISFFHRNESGVARLVGEAAWTEPWLRRLTSGMKFADLAFDTRGHEFADKVKPEGWKGFYENMAAARKDLEEAWKLRPDRPEAPSEMLGVLLSGRTMPGESERLWFDRTVAAQMDFLGAYYKMINRLRPRWGGSYEELLAFGRECLGASTRRSPSCCSRRSIRSNGTRMRKRRAKWLRAPTAIPGPIACWPSSSKATWPTRHTRGRVPIYTRSTPSRPTRPDTPTRRFDSSRKTSSNSPRTPAGSSKSPRRVSWPGCRLWADPAADPSSARRSFWRNGAWAKPERLIKIAVASIRAHTRHDS